MTVPGEFQVGIAACLDDITQAFRDGGAIIDKIKRKRALKRAPPPPRLLEESIDQAPSEIEREKQRGLNRYGKVFEEGDHLAVIALQQICIQLQQSLLEKLRNAAFDDDKAITDFTYLVDAADTGRDRTIAALYDFKTRLSLAEQEQYGEQQQPLRPVISNTSAQSSASNVSTPLPNDQQQLQRTNTQLSTTSSTTSPPAPPPAAAPTTASTAPPAQPTQRQILQEYEAQRRASKPPIWQKDYSNSRDASGEEDAASGGAEENNHHLHPHRKRSSLLHFLKHSRTNSSEMKDKDKLRDRSTSVLSQPISEEPSSPIPPRSPPTSVPFRAPTQCDASSPGRDSQQMAKFTYEEWNDGNSSDMWSTRKKSLERRETVALAPDQPLSNAGSTSHLPLQPPSPVLTHRTNSSLTARDTLASTAIQTPNPENEFLGFCKGAWKLQNGDRKGSMHKASEVNPWSRHQSVTANQYLSCQQPKCAFRSSFTSPQIETIWNRVFTVENKGLKLRWTFLAKSHVSQKVVVKHQYSFQCLFCTFLGGKEAAGVYHGLDDYLEHVNNEHRRRTMNDVVCYKTGCIQGRVANDDEEFDINIWPPNMGGPPGERKQSVWQNEDFMRDQGFPHEGWGNVKDGKSDSMFSDEPWNEGLSDFHYHGELDRLETI